MSHLTLVLCLFGLACSQVLAELGTEAIVGGHYAKKGEFKYQAVIQSDGELRCGGVIIDKSYILTAAHCVVMSPETISGHVNSFTILVGTHNPEEGHHVIDHAEHIYVHKHFNYTTGEHDIAVIKLKHELDLSSHKHNIEKVELPNANANFNGVTAVISGYGIQSLKVKQDKDGVWEIHDFKSDMKLKYAPSKVITNAQCAELKKKYIYPSMMCGQVIQHDKHGEGACVGDSGGPLVHEKEVIGILSKVPFSCNESHDAAVYSRVSFYADTIHEIIKGETSHNFVVR